MTGRLYHCRAALALCTLIALAGVPAVARAQVSVSAALDAERTPVGHSVRLVITVIGADREIVPPTGPVIAGVETFSAGQSQRFSFVNGRSRAEYSWSWSLIPRRAGTVTIPPIAVTVDGSTHQTQALSFEVVAGSTVPDAGATGQDAPDAGADLPDAFVRMRVDQDTVVVGEQVILTFSFYRASRASMFESPEYVAPRTEGFWREDLPPESHRREVVRSRRYEVTEIQYALFPTRVGDLEIGEATVRLPDDAFGSFFRRSNRRAGPSILTTDAIAVHVKPLPEPQPADFSGTIASALTLRSAVDRRELEQGDALTWRIRLEGTGHLEAAAVPAPQLGPEFKVHESTSSSDSGPDKGQLRGSRTVEYLVIPQQPGDLVLPALDYSWFDSSRGQYVRARTEAIPIRVAPSEGATPSVFTGGRKSEIELLARDILHIEPLDQHQAAWKGPLASRPGFWALCSLAPVAWGLSAVFARRRRVLLADPGRLRARNARSRARAALNGTGPVDQRVGSAVEGYLADRFDRSASGLVRDEVTAFLESESVPPALIDRTRQLLDRCDALRFAPGGSAEESLLAEARGLIDELEGVFNA